MGRMSKTQFQMAGVQRIIKKKDAQKIEIIARLFLNKFFLTNRTFNFIRL